jgi:plastocyanin
MRCMAAAGAALVLGVFASGCSGSAAATPGAPSPAVGAITIDIIGVYGDRSFSPNPALVPAGQTVVWHNLDIVTHHVVLDDRGVDTGDVAPGHFSAPAVMGASAPYHCAIHPSMGGALGEQRSVAR